MKKLLVGAALIAISVGGYLMLSKDSAIDSTGSNERLAAIPADTLLFFGNTKPFPIKSYVNSLSGLYYSPTDEADSAYIQDEEPVIQFLYRLNQTYMESLQSGDTFVTTFGLNEAVESYSYTLGLMPVVTFEVANSQAFWHVLDDAEQQSGFNHQLESLEGQSYRSYRLNDANSPNAVSLIFSERNGFITITIAADIFEVETLALALGLRQADNSLAESDKLSVIIEEYQFEQDTLGFFDHQYLIKGITTTDSNLMAKQLTKLAQRYPEFEGEFDSQQRPECQQELSAIAANWPKTVFGFTSIEIGDQQSQFNLSTVIESKNSVILDALMKMRGFIPDFAQNVNGSAIAIALGLDVNQIGSSMNAISTELLSVEYQCAPLQQLQAEIANSEIGMLGMMSGMANGVFGISAALIDFELKNSAQMNQKHDQSSELPEVSSIDALVTLSAKDPQMLFNFAKGFIPTLAHIQLATDGTPVDLRGVFPFMAQYGVSPQLAIKGEHLVIYSGEKAQKLANSLSSQPIAQNGLSSVSVDYSKVLTPMLSYIDLSDEPLPQEMLNLENYNMEMRFSTDVTNKGVVFDSYILGKAKPLGQ